MSGQEKAIGDWLVYLVIALVIMAVVGVVLFPTIGLPSRTVARYSSCQGNLKECAIALQTYSDDYNGHLPSSAIVNHAEQWSKPDFTAFATLRGGLPVNGAPKTWSQVLYNCMKNKDITFCPSDSADPNDPRSHVSYYWKAAIDKAWYGVGCKKPCRRASDFVYNADQVVLYERAGFHSGEPNGLRNNTQINVAFLDSHVRSVSVVNCSASLETDPAAPGEPRYFNYDFSRLGTADNPPLTATRTTYTDPSVYGDKLP